MYMDGHTRCLLILELVFQSTSEMETVAGIVPSLLPDGVVELGSNLQQTYW